MKKEQNQKNPHSPQPQTEKKRGGRNPTKHKTNQNQQSKSPTRRKLSSPRHFFRVSREVTPPGSDCATGRRRRGARSRPVRGASRGGPRSPGGGTAQPAPGRRGGTRGEDGTAAAAPEPAGARTCVVCVSCYCRKREIPERAPTRRTRRHLTMRERSCTPAGRDRPERPAACPGEGRDRTETLSGTPVPAPSGPAGGRGTVAATAPPRRGGSGLR